MALTIAEIKDLIRFGRAEGLQSLTIDGCAVMYGTPLVEQQPAVEPQPSDDVFSALPEELRHYSALGKVALGKVVR